MNRIGFTCRNTREVPCECDAVQQEVFAAELSKLFECSGENTVICYADGVHPARNSRSTYTLTEKSKAFLIPRRVNISGMINAKDVPDVIALDCPSVNAESAEELCQKALEKHPEVQKICIISDNTRYYRNKELKERIKDTKIIRLFLPPCSPNLSDRAIMAISQKKVINTRFYRAKELFRQAIRNFFENIADYKSELETFMSLNFRLINAHPIYL